MISEQQEQTFDAHELSTAAEANMAQQGYNKNADEYLERTLSKPSPRMQWLEKLLRHLKPTARVVELGCGAGLPVTKLLTEKVAEVIGNDISSEQVKLASLVRRTQYVEH